MSSTIDLGHLRLRCPSVSRTLSLSNVAYLSHLDSTQDVINLRNSASSWVGAGASLRLVLDVDFNDHPLLSVFELHHIQNLLTNSLCHAPVRTGSIQLPVRTFALTSVRALEPIPL